MYGLYGRTDGCTDARVYGFLDVWMVRMHGCTNVWIPRCKMGRSSKGLGTSLSWPTLHRSRLLYCFATELLRVSECWYDGLITCTRTHHQAPWGDSQVSKRQAHSGLCRDRKPPTSGADRGKPAAARWKMIIIIIMIIITIIITIIIIIRIIVWALLIIRNTNYSGSWGAPDGGQVVGGAVPPAKPGVHYNILYDIISCVIVY